MRIGSLFSGIGGLELGMERSGLGQVVWQVEIDPFCRRILAKHWPEVQKYEDVKEVGSELEPVDLICGGFPCQDVSSAGKGAGLSGSRSGLWYEYLRVVEALAPSWVVVENVASGKRRWLPYVRRDLHVLGYRTRAFQLSAADVGAPHLRRRVFVVAHAERGHLREQPGRSEGANGTGAPVPAIDGIEGLVGDAMREGREGPDWHANARRSEPAQRSGRIDPWSTEPDLGGTVDGISSRMDGWERDIPRTATGVANRKDRLKALGNAVVPQCAEVIGRMIRDGVV